MTLPSNIAAQLHATMRNLAQPLPLLGCAKLRRSALGCALSEAIQAYDNQPGSALGCAVAHIFQKSQSRSGAPSVFSINQ